MSISRIIGKVLRADIAASGGTESTVGGKKIHTFTSTGNLVVSRGGNVDVLLVGGGAGSGSQVGGGGGAGGVKVETGFAVVASTITATVGAGGVAETNGHDGANSTFSTLTAVGGGKGGGGADDGQHGGSGGGGGWYGSLHQSEGSGTSGQGNAGAATPNYDVPTPCGGGGGAGGAGAAPPDKDHGGQGGAGVANDYSGSEVYYGGGGSGGYAGGVGPPIAGGSGGGGTGTTSGYPLDGSGGTANRGGGAGGFSEANGGSGIIIVRYGASGFSKCLGIVTSGIKKICGVSNLSAGSGTFYPGADADDGQWYPVVLGGGMAATGTYQIGFGTHDDYYSFFGRFVNVTVPQGAKITSAKMTFTANFARSGTDPVLKIVGHDVDDAAAPSAWTDLRDAPLVASTVQWSPGDWDLDADYDTPSIASLVQNIVDRGGWASGNDMLFQIRGNGYPTQGAGFPYIESGHVRNGYNYTAGSTKMPRLVIEYEVFSA